MVKIELFKNCVFNNNDKVSNFTNFAEQKAYFDNYPSSDKTIYDDVKISSLYEPFIIADNLTNLFEFTYGRITFNENTRLIYFSINRFEIVTEYKTLVYFDIDYWETYRYPIDNGNSLKMGRGTLSRCSLDLPFRKLRAYNPIFKSVIPVMAIIPPSNSPNESTEFFSLIVCWHNNSTDFDMVSILQAYSIQDLISNEWVKNRSFDASQVFSYWLSPFHIDTSSLTATWFNPKYRMYDFEKSVFTSLDIKFNFNNILPSFSEDYQVGITDANRSLLWIANDDVRGTNIILHLGVSLKSCNWYGYVYTSNDDVYKNPASYFTIPCEPLDLFSDAFIRYYTQERPFLAESRRIQRDQAFISGLTNVGTSAIGGAIAGSMVAPGPGTIAGAIGGAVASTVGTAVNYESDKIYAKQIQENEDRQAKISSDELRFDGSAISEIIHFRTRPTVVKINPDNNTLSQYKKDIESYGYFYDVEILDFETIIGNNINVKMRANVEIENVPTIAENSIFQRLANGVTFIRPNWE